MTHRMSARHALWLIPVILGLWAGAEVYRSYLDHWRGSLRAPLVAGSVAGIAFIIVGTAIVKIQDREADRARP